MPVFRILIFLFTVNLVLPRSMETSGVFSFGGGWLSGGGGRGKECVSKAGKKAGQRLSAGSVGGSSLMPLSVVQGDHRGDAGAEEESLPPSRESRKSSAALPSGLRVCGGRRYVHIMPWHHHCWIDRLNRTIVFPHMSTDENINKTAIQILELICPWLLNAVGHGCSHMGEQNETVNELLYVLRFKSITHDPGGEYRSHSTVWFSWESMNLCLQLQYVVPQVTLIRNQLCRMTTVLTSWIVTAHGWLLWQPVVSSVFLSRRSMRSIPPCAWNEELLWVTGLRLRNSSVSQRKSWF